MLSEKIATWLASLDDYQAGLALLRETGYSGFTLTVLSMGEDAYNRTRLEMELRKWLDRPNNISLIGLSTVSTANRNSEPIIPEFPTKPATVPVEIPKKQASEPEPLAVEDLRKQIYGLMDERAEAKAWLRAKEGIGNTESAMAERLPYALRVKAITRQIDEIYSRLDFFAEHGYLPLSDLSVAVDDTVALMNARSYVSRYKARLKTKNLTADQRQSAQKLLSQYTDEKNRLEQKTRKPHVAI